MCLHVCTNKIIEHWLLKKSAQSKFEIYRLKFHENVPNQITEEKRFVTKNVHKIYKKKLNYLELMCIT